ncbi:YbhB/YbcL family Raf kinase inhibitor-like protein [Variovorax sp. KBW07]|uniref:YbhB/YbcL family Raf kinase inhibitor-like protein n=1 Tax=Variovorax sp. KBW07 TaxID=2153358 RepID=UPI000F560934|nr:YbhB/YbcL family Raf kinase inhibitor-like protein [Variovorax sp. KBW07]RQO63829.1 YbhB/YbcL family Raf kinase inhibitor-like protein [Variovorax sp. KBW07]
MRHARPHILPAAALALAGLGLLAGCTAMQPATTTGGKAPTGLKVTSSAFADNTPIPAEHAGVGDCGGKNISMPVAWHNLPAKAKSVAVLLSDPDGAAGLGVSHWVAYNIAAERGQLKAGEAQPGADFTLGPNVAGAAAYRGMCPPVGDHPHHYVLTVVASDLAPGALPAGLSRDALLAALKGHALGGQSVVGLYSR